MYQWFQVKNYRGLADLRLDNFQRVNLITGMNNVGKSNLLEALFIHSGAYNPNLILTVRTLRGLDRLKVELGSWAKSPFGLSFFRGNITVPIEFSGEDRVTGHRITRLNVVKEPSELPPIPRYVEELSDEVRRPGVASSAEPIQGLKLESEVNGNLQSWNLVLTLNQMYTVPSPSSPPFQTHYTLFLGGETEAELYTNLVKKGKESVVLNVLKIIDPRLQSVFLLSEADKTRLWGRLDFGTLPLLDMGGGILRLVNYAIRIANSADGVVLIDEIDNGLHYSILPQIWRFIGDLAKEFNTQVFATTHSRDCVRAAHQAFLASGDYDFSLYRLQRVTEYDVEAVKYDQETLDIALDAGLEVR